VKIQHPHFRRVLPPLLWLLLLGEAHEGCVPLKGLGVALIVDGGRLRHWHHGPHSADTAGGGGGRTETIRIKQDDGPFPVVPVVHLMPVFVSVKEGWHVLQSHRLLVRWSPQPGGGLFLAIGIVLEMLLVFDAGDAVHFGLKGELAIGASPEEHRVK